MSTRLHVVCLDDADWLLPEILEEGRAFWRLMDT